MRASRPERLAGSVASAACLGVLAIGACLRPSAAGAGTHEQLGLPPCGMLLVTGLPCPSCGMTTAVSLAAHGRFFDSLMTQPFGLLFAVAAAVGFWGGLHVAIGGARVVPLVARLALPRVMWSVAALWALSWLYKVLAWTH